MKKNIQVIVVGVLVLLMIAGSFRQKEELIRFEASFLDVFDTQTQIIGYGTSKEEFSEQIELIKEKLTYYHKLYNIYEDYEGISNMKTINDNAGIQAVKVDTEIINLLKLSVEAEKTTNGNVNVAFGSVLALWHDYREEGINQPLEAKLPPMKLLQKANEHTNIENIVIDETAGTIYLADSEMSLDVGSIGKGYAVQRTSEYAREELGITNMLISVGGNVSAIGAHMDGTPWRLGIQNPDLSSNETYVCKVDIKDASVVTSGNYQRYYMVDNKRYCHIIRPDTLMPSDYFPSVSVITEDSGNADMFSTMLYNMDYETGMAYVESYDGVEAMWVLEDGTIKYSSGFSKYLPEE